VGYRTAGMRAATGGRSPYGDASATGDITDHELPRQIAPQEARRYRRRSQAPAAPGRSDRRKARPQTCRVKVRPAGRLRVPVLGTEIAEDRPQGIDEIIESPEKPVDGEVSREHTPAGSEDPQRAADPGAPYSVGGRSEQQRKPSSFSVTFGCSLIASRRSCHRFKPSAV